MQPCVDLVFFWLLSVICFKACLLRIMHPEDGIDSVPEHNIDFNLSSNFIFLLNAYQQIQTSASKLHFFHVLNTGDVQIEREQTPVWPDPP